MVVVPREPVFFRSITCKKIGKLHFC
jgi:hypothetical protein